MFPEECWKEAIGMFARYMLGHLKLSQDKRSIKQAKESDPQAERKGPGVQISHKPDLPGIYTEASVKSEVKCFDPHGLYLSNLACFVLIKNQYTCK